MHFNHTDLSKISVCFTWDDNCHAHCRITAPIFLEHGMRCTFYINPGKEGYRETYIAGYREAMSAGFEIGSHGLYHNHMSEIGIEELGKQIKAAADGINSDFGIYPSTFAFPYHEYDESTLAAARRFHLETRNTLRNSARLSVRTSVTADEMISAIDECVKKGNNIVFSGHSAVLSAQDLGLPESGYEPILAENLKAVLEYARTLRDRAEVLTFEQAALKEYLRDTCEITGDTYTLNNEQADYLNTFGIDARRLSVLV